MEASEITDLTNSCGLECNFPVPQFRPVHDRGSEQHRLDTYTACSRQTPCLSLPVTASFLKWLRRPPRERKIPGSNSACDGIFSGLSHTSDLKIGTPVATLPGAWRYRVSAGTGLPGVSIL